jgi:hypothetical protein
MLNASKESSGKSRRFHSYPKLERFRPNGEEERNITVTQQDRRFMPSEVIITNKGKKRRPQPIKG